MKNGGFGFKFRADGAIALNLGSGEQFVGVFAYDNLFGSAGGCGDLDIAAPVGPSKSPS